jgi:hypothetical protein
VSGLTLTKFGHHESLLAPVGPDRRVLSASRAMSLSFTTVYYPFLFPGIMLPPACPGAPPFWARARAAYPPARISRAYTPTRRIDDQSIAAFQERVGT